MLSRDGGDCEGEGVLGRCPSLYSQLNIGSLAATPLLACLPGEHDLTKSLVMGFEFWGYARERVTTGKVNGNAAVEFT